MTIKKKLILSNVLMICIPTLLAIIFGTVILETYGNRYWESLEEMYDNEDGVYSAQSIIYAYKEELGRKEWENYDELEDDPASFFDKTKQMMQLEQELTAMGYHFEICVDGHQVFSNLEETDQSCITRYFDDSIGQISSLTLSDRGCAVIKNTFEIEDEICEITAVYEEGRVTPGAYESYLSKYIVAVGLVFLLLVFLSVIVTDAALTGWISRMILRPLGILRTGTRRVAEGNLEESLCYDKNDEFGEVCSEFDQMRGRLQESVETRLRYEQYRKDLIIGISHDLRTPLTSIKGYVEGLEDGIANTEERKKRYYHAIHTRALDMEMLVDSLTVFARLEKGEYKYHLELVDLKEYIRELLLQYREEAEQKQALIFYDHQAGETYVRMDILEMRRVFINLFENSIKYRVKNKTVIHMESGLEGETVIIRVADDGPGVPKEELEHIFESFYRVDESRTKSENGSGLGLAIVRQIVEGHGGTIQARNERGLVMIIRLPLCIAQRVTGHV